MSAPYSTGAALIATARDTQLRTGHPHPGTTVDGLTRTAAEHLAQATAHPGPATVAQLVQAGAYIAAAIDALKSTPPEAR